MCVWENRVGGWVAGFPTEKQPNPSPGLFETLNRNRRQDAPGREAAPARISLAGGAAMTHPPPPSPSFLVCISPPGHVAAGAASRRGNPDTLALLPRHTSQGCSCPRGFSGLWLVPALRTRVGTPPLRVPCPTPSPTVRPGVSSPPPQPVREGKGAGSTGGVTAPARTSASCSLASVPRASWLFRLGRRRSLGAPCRWGRGDSPPPNPQPSTHPRGASPPSSASGCSGSRASWKLALVTAPGT